jgi:hypothetical protein
VSRVAGPAVVALGLAAVVAGCSVTAGPTFPPIGSSPAPAGEVTSGARAQVAAALAVEGLQVDDAKTAYRPPEGPLFASAPRTVIQVALPDDPTHGYIILYAFGTPQQARVAAEDQATYIAGGPGKVQFTPGTSFSLRVLGNIAIFYTWTPDNAPDARTPSLALALSQVGDEIAIPG